MLWSVYANCDPITGGQIKKADQLLPLLVLQVAGDTPCLPGLFMAGVFSGSLSTISSGLNSLAAIGLRDLMPADTRSKMGESWQALVTKLMALGFGCIGYALTFVIRMMPSMLEVGILITGVVAGPTVGLFIAGMFLPCVDARAALIGFVGSSLLTGWMAVGSFIYSNDRADFSALPSPNSTSSCPTSWTNNDQFSSTAQPSTYLGNSHLDLYDVSSIWYSAIGVALVLILALFSYCFLPSKKSESVDPQLLSPLLRPFLSSTSSSSYSSPFFCCTSTSSSPSSPFLPSFSFGSKGAQSSNSTPPTLPCTIMEVLDDGEAKNEEMIESSAKEWAGV